MFRQQEDTYPYDTGDVRTSSATLMTGNALCWMRRSTLKRLRPPLIKVVQGHPYPIGASALNLTLTHQYEEGRGLVTRTTLGTAADLGAFERP